MGQGGVRRKIAGATGMMMAGILLSRILGLVRDRLIAHHFGQGRDTDIYNAAFMIPDLMFFLIAGGAFSAAFIPVFTEYISTERPKEAWRIFSVVALAMASVVSAAILLGELFAPWLVSLTNPGYAADPDKLRGIVTLTRILLPAQLCFFLGGLMMGSQTARGMFLGQAFGPVIYNLGIILGGLLFHRTLGVAGLCWGALAGAIVGNLALQWYLVIRSGGYFVRGAWRKYRRHPGVKQVWRLMLPVIFGLALPQVSTIINRAYASYLGDGPQSALMNANRLMQVPLGLFAQATAIAIFPTLSAQAAHRDLVAFRSTINFGIRAILFLTIPSSFVMVVLALPIVQLILHSGKFQLREDLDAASALIYYSLGIFAWSAHSIITRGFYAQQDSRTPVIVGTLVTLLFLPLNSLLITRMGADGLALATSIAATLHMGLLLLLLRVRLHGIQGPLLVRSVGCILLASAAAALVCRILRDLLAGQFAHLPHLSVTARAAVTLTVCLTAATVVYLGIAAFLGMEEVRPLRRILRRFA